jgi:tRNA-specific 2-thiouridylase
MSFESKFIVVAMSGGVDSSTVATMLCKQGHKVVGVTMQLYDHGQITKKGACCAGQDIYDAKRVASDLGIPHYVLDYESHFRSSVIENFVDSYMKGETPLPCVRCNQSVKFRDLLKFAKDIGADFLATGHYVRKITNNNGNYELHTGVDQGKDHSYFLFATTKEQLDLLMFPLGTYTKEQTRQLAVSYNLETADKPDSQDICFVPGGDYREVITKIRPEAINPGTFMHVDGYALGQHKGIINYTVGQRRGIGIAHGEPLYVVKIDPESNIVYLGPDSALLKKQFIVQDVNWIEQTSELYDKNHAIEVELKIRSTMKPVMASISFSDNRTASITLLSQEKSITPGQAAVFYHGSKVLGGGWITHDII